jgi:ketosteroid isomerase-like protein
MAPMSAVERFLTASRAHDVEAAAAELAPDVVLLNPATDDPVAGKRRSLRLFARPKQPATSSGIPIF